jgi:hypothetical protein
MDAGVAEPEVSSEAQAANPNPPETAPQPSNLPPMGGGANAQMPAAATQPAAQPTVVPIAPQKRGGLAGIVDEFRDAISGTQAPKMATDAQGNPYVAHTDLTGAQKWMRVASTALHGAAAGWAAGRGAGHGGDALEAGVNAGDKQVAQRQKQEQDVDEQVRQAKLDKFNFVKLQHDQAAQEWQLQHLKVQAQQQEVEFAQKQIDHEMNDLKSIDLGTYKDPFDFAKVQQQDPNFWKNAYNKQVVSYPELDADGNRVGVHFFLRDENANARLAPAGTQIATFTPPGKDEEPKLTFVTPTGPMRNDDVTTRNAAATNAYNAFVKQREESRLKDAEAAEHLANASKVPSEIGKNSAQTAEALASANRSNAEADKARSTNPNTADNAALIDEIGTGKVSLSRLDYIVARKPELLDAVAAKYPGFDSTKAKNYVDASRDFTSGKTSVQLNSGATALLHLKKLQELNTTASHIPGTAAYNAYRNQLDTLAPELAKFYGDTTVPAIAALKSTLGSQLPRTRDAAIKTQAQSMGAKFDNFEQTWKNAAPSAAYQAKVPQISDAAKEARAALDPAYKQRLVQEQGGPTAPPRPATVPPNAQWNPQGNNGKGSWQLP